ncbi:hypothetical protein JCM11491_000776 [Sporobolomyces phaffii]
MNSMLRSSILRRPFTPSSVSKRFASTTPPSVPHPTSPRALQPQHYTPIQWARKFIPTEAYPLIFLASSMCAYGLYHAYSRIVHVPGELRLVPQRFGDERAQEPWEDERAKQGVW